MPTKMSRIYPAGAQLPMKIHAPEEVMVVERAGRTATVVANRQSSVTLLRRQGFVPMLDPGLQPTDVQAGEITDRESYEPAKAEGRIVETGLHPAEVLGRPRKKKG